MGLLNKLMGKKGEDSEDKQKGPAAPPKKQDHTNSENMSGPSSMPQDSDVEEMIHGKKQEEQPSAPPQQKNNKVLNPGAALLKKQQIDQGKPKTPTPPKKEQPATPPTKPAQSQDTPSKPEQSRDDSYDAMAELKKSLGKTNKPPTKPQKPSESPNKKTQSNKQTSNKVDDGIASYEIPDFDDDLDIDINTDDILGSQEEKKPEPEPDFSMMMEEPEPEPEPVKQEKTSLPRFDVNEDKVNEEVGFDHGKLFISRLHYAEILRKEKSLSKNLQKLDAALKDLEAYAEEENQESRKFEQKLKGIQEDVMSIDYKLFEVHR